MNYATIFWVLFGFKLGDLEHLQHFSISGYHCYFSDKNRKKLNLLKQFWNKMFKLIIYKMLEQKFVNRELIIYKEISLKFKLSLHLSLNRYPLSLSFSSLLAPTSCSFLSTGQQCSMPSHLGTYKNRAPSSPSSSSSLHWFLLPRANSSISNSRTTPKQRKTRMRSTLSTRPSSFSLRRWTQKISLSVSLSRHSGGAHTRETRPGSLLLSLSLSVAKNIGAGNQQSR